MSLASTAALSLAGLLGVVMAAEGAMKLVGLEDAEGFERFGYPTWFHPVVGVLEVGGGAGVLAGLVVGDVVVRAAAGLLVVVLAGAVTSHLRVGDSPAETAPATVLLVIATLVVAAATLPV